MAEVVVSPQKLIFFISSVVLFWDAQISPKADSSDPLINKKMARTASAEFNQI